ncbi:MAG: hypothetical protein P1R58_04535 [bacterium]|nr:hypothetical protein [bacterium]
MKLGAHKYLLVAMVVTTAWVFFAYRPLDRQLDQGYDRIKAARIAMDDFSSTLQQLPEFEKSCQTLEQSRRELNETLYTKRDVLRLFEHLQQRAAENNLKVVEISPPIEELIRLNQAVSDSTVPLFLNIGLNLEGSYRDYGNFVKSTEQSAYYRGTNLCQIIGARNDIRRLAFKYSFKALLGNVEERS